MAILRTRPYEMFNFQVNLGDGNTQEPQAGFQDVIGLGMGDMVIECRTGNSKENTLKNLTGLNRVSDVTLIRGIVSSRDIKTWLDQTRNGDQKAVRTVTIQLQNEDRSNVVQSWKLLNARIKHTRGPTGAKGPDVAIEEIVLSCERLEME